MGGPSGYGQRNKPHKSGSKGLSARQKHRLGKASAPAKPGTTVGSRYSTAKLQRHIAAKQHRDQKRSELLDRKRTASCTPILVAILPLSQDVDVARLWQGMLAACAHEPSAHREERDAAVCGDDVAMMDGAEVASSSLRVITVSVGGRSKQRLTLIPPPTNRNCPFGVVALARVAEVVILAVPASEHSQTIDTEGAMALTVLRSMGVPHTVLAVQGPQNLGSKDLGEVVGTSSAALNMKERAAAKKRAEKAVSACLAGEHTACCADDSTDCAQLLRRVVEHPAVALPHWRTQRPALMVEAAEYVPAPDEAVAGAGGGLLHLTGWVRVAGMSANKLLTIEGAGDFQILRIEMPPEPQTVLGVSAREQARKANSMDSRTQEPIILAQAAEELREPLTRENRPVEDDTVGGGDEQTWPTAAEVAMFQRRRFKRKLPQGISDYQAAWLVDVNEDDEEGEEGEESDIDSSNAPEGVIMAKEDDDDSMEMDGPCDLSIAADQDDTGMERDERDEDADSEGTQAPESRWARLQAEKRAQREAEGQDAQYPDELDVPPGVQARQRLQKYRGLKSFRSSPWDPKEWLPPEYARIFAFQNIKRAHKRALADVARATRGEDPCAVEPGTWVRVVVRGVSESQAQSVLQRVAQSGMQATGVVSSSVSQLPPLVVFSLMTYEAKMSVVHFSIQKAAGYTDALPNKELLTFVTGLRTYPTRPLFSSDNHGDKHKMERWLRSGHACVASVYAPITYPPLPLLAFKESTTGGPAQLAATGAVRNSDPDRIILKRIVLTGYPVRVHKQRCTVRYMFHEPDDVRWFRPVELYTRAGRRGRITEPLGTHGAFKALFDGPVQQQDVVCMNLYKRVHPTCPVTSAYPKWPVEADLRFA